MNETFDKLQFLITRPKHQATSLADKIAAKGGIPVLLPTIEIQPPPILVGLQQQLAELPTQDFAIFLSANTLRFTAAYFPAPFPPTLVTIAIGQATARALTDANIPVHLLPDDSSSEGLLAMPALQKVHGKHVMIFCGQDSRALLKETLMQRGARVAEAVCYQRTSSKEAAQILTTIHLSSMHGVVCASNQSLTHFLELLSPEQKITLAHIPLITISQRMTDYARQVMDNPVITQASDASDEAIIQALIHATSAVTL